MTHTTPCRRFSLHPSIGVTLLLCAVWVGPLVLGWYGGWQWTVAGSLGVGLVMAYGTFYPHSRLFGLATRSFPTAERTVILTIDDGPCADTEEMLHILAAHRARAGEKAGHFLRQEEGRRRDEDPTEDVELVDQDGLGLVPESLGLRIDMKMEFFPGISGKTI